MAGVGIVLVACAALAAGAAEAAGSRPDVVVLVTGDLQPLPAAGVATPHIDRIAAHGRRFDHAFSSSPDTTFARAALLAGRPAGDWGWKPERIAGARTLPAAFVRGGYEAVRVGTLLGAEADRAFGWTATYPADGIEAALGQVEASLTRSPRPQLVVAALDQARLPAAVLARFPPEAQALPPALLLPRPRVALAAGSLERPGGVVTPGPRPEAERRRLRAEAQARIALVDASLEGLVQLLDAGDRWSHTVVVLVGDRVPPTGDLGLLEREDTLFDASLHVPLVVAAPGARNPGAATGALAQTLDVFPTLLDLAGLPATSAASGASLRPILEDATRATHRSVISEAARDVVPLGRSARTARFRYTEWPDGTEELYDHDADPNEWRNLAGVPGNEAALAEMRRRIAERGSSPGPPPPRLPPPPTPRNVLLIVSDDLSVRLGAYGFPLQTPNIDRLAARGRLFAHAYAPVAVCSPSRTSLLTGLGPERHGVWSNRQPVREQLGGVVPLNDLFHAAGRFTARVGKVFHQHWDPQFSWDLAEHDVEEEQRAGPESRREGRRARRAEGRARERFEEDQGIGSGADLSHLWLAEPGPDSDQPDAARAERVARLLEERRDRPFFVALGLAKPHLRWVFPKKYLELYPLDRVPLVDPPADDGRDIPALAVGRLEAHAPGLVGVPITIFPEDARRHAIAAHNACVSFVDAQVGVVMDALERARLWDTTTVVLVGDHGFHLGEHGVWGKDTLFEEAVQAPLVIASPEVERPGVPAQGLVEFVDVYPTLVELAGLGDPPQRLDGRSLAPMLRDPSFPGRSAAFSWKRTEVEPAGRSLRTDRFRYTEWPDGSQELYEIPAGGFEGRNLAGLPEHAALRERLRSALRQPR